MMPDDHSKIVRLEQRVEDMGDVVKATAAVPLEVATMKQKLEDLSGHVDNNRAWSKKEHDQLSAAIATAEERVNQQIRDVEVRLKEDLQDVKASTDLIGTRAWQVLLGTLGPAAAAVILRFVFGVGT